MGYFFDFFVFWLKINSKFYWKSWHYVIMYLVSKVISQKPAHFLCAQMALLLRHITLTIRQKAKETLSKRLRTIKAWAVVNFTTKAGKMQATPWLINTKTKEKLRLETINEELSCETKTMHLNQTGW